VKPLLWIGTSPIAGRGLFTAQAITRGTRIIQYRGEKIPKAESDKRLAEGNVYIFQLNDRYDIDGKVLRNKARYINHSSVGYSHDGMEPGNPEVFGILMALQDMGQALSVLLGVSCSRRYKPY
jgi:SET domain-containing protein